MALGIVLLTLGTLAAVGLRAGGFSPAAADWAAVRFTVVQAAVSSAVSVVLAVPVARALFRRRFPGRGGLILLMGAPFLLPVMVAVIGLLAVFGRAGVFNQALAAVGLPPVSIFGLHGVILAHVFLNLPLAVRMLLQGWQAIPAERFRLATSLGFGPGAVFRHLEAPMLRATAPGVAVVIFLVCLTSFAVVLTLGGGPRATNVELAIYQAVRFEFDLGRAAGLAGVQFALCAASVALAGWVAIPTGFGAGLDRAADLPGPGGWRRMADAAAILLAAGFLMVPLAAVVLRGLPGLADLPASIGWALLRSVAVALGAAALSVTAALVLALAVARGAAGRRLFEGAAMLPMAASGLVLGTGLFLIVHPFVTVERLALPVTLLVNAVMALPFVFRLLLPQARAMEADYGRLAEALDLRGPARLRWVVLPRLAAPLGFGAGIAAALSMGDLGVVALFAGERGVTLPLLVSRLTAAYRMEQAAGAALVLMAASFTLFAILDRGGRRIAGA
ncbi:MAG: ABC transporter permease subunit [Paracoccaceae bacterium]